MTEGAERSVDLAPVPFVDLGAQLRAIRPDIEAALGDCLDRGDYIQGVDTRLFEEEFAAFLGAREVVGVASGLDALTLGFEALGVGQGSTCVVPANTFVATALGASRLGARIVWCDVDAESRLMTRATLERALAVAGPAPTVVPVHLCGRAVEPDVFALCAERGLTVVEDAAQSHGAAFRDGGMTGTRGRLGCFSFYPGKNLGAYGDAGAVVTSDLELAERVRRLGNYGQRVKYEHQVRGVNSRLDTMQAAVLRVKLRHLSTWNEARCQAAGHYDQLLAGPDARGLRRPPLGEPGTHSWHLYTVALRDRGERDAALERLRRAGIAAGIHYPVPCHLQPCYAGRGGEAAVSLTVAEDEAERTLSLPMYPEITAAQQVRVVEALIGA